MVGCLFKFEIAQALYRKLSEERVGWQVRTLTGHSSTVSSIAFSADGKRIVGGALRPAHVIVWDIETGAVVSSLVGVRGGRLFGRVIQGRPWSRWVDFSQPLTEKGTGLRAFPEKRKSE